MAQRTELALGERGPQPVMTDEGVPLHYQQCLDTYKFMLENKSSSTHPDSQGFPVYQGHLTKDLDEALGFSVSQYSRIIRTLIDMECIFRVHRGSPSTPAIWAIVQEPELESFSSVRKTTYRRSKLSQREFRQRIADLSSSMSQIRSLLMDDAIPRITEMEERIDKIDWELRNKPRD